MFEKLHLCITYEMNGAMNSEVLSTSATWFAAAVRSLTTLGNGKSHVDATCQALARACGRFVT